MAPDIDVSDMISIISLVVVILLTILIYVWRKRDKREEDHSDMKVRVGKIESRHEALKEKLRDTREVVDRLDLELNSGMNQSKTEMGDLKTSVERLGSEGRSISARLNEIGLNLTKIDDRIDKMREKLRDIEAEVKEARRYSHRHTFFGESV